MIMTMNLPTTSRTTEMGWLKTLGRQGTETKSVTYSNGGCEYWENGFLTSVRYNTGDVIHLAFENEEYRVIRVETHNGLIWEESSSQIHPYGASKTP